eukprot:TRINITY_DN15994_c0_g1_i1.p1 TRINITY_DN15994_c0_g1~~TRINITY_DN15994_c0_g1_i1.p1  ORF type:complete len:262 (+),score=44.04 TRINITY_DN15994_c0_g1_i1:812-1597(+)
MGCGASTETPSVQVTHVTPAEEPLTAAVRKDAKKVLVDVIDCERLSVPAVDMDVELYREKGHVVCKVEGLRRPYVTKMYYDDYWGFLRFPDTGRGGKIKRDAELPAILGRLLGLGIGTDCQIHIPKEVSLDLDIAGGYQRGQRVKAHESIYVGNGILAVGKGGKGTIIGPSQDRVNVKWDQRVDGKQKNISVKPAEIRLCNDLPGSFLRGSKVQKTKTNEPGVVTGPDPYNQSCLLVIWGDDLSAVPQPYPHSELTLMYQD